MGECTNLRGIELEFLAQRERRFAPIAQRHGLITRLTGCGLLA